MDERWQLEKCKIFLEVGRFHIYGGMKMTMNKVHMNAQKYYLGEIVVSS